MKTCSSMLRLLALAWLIGLPISSRAANLVVTNLADSGAGSLRAVVNTANANPDADVITFGAALSGKIIALDSTIVLSNQVTIDATGLTNGITIILAPIPMQVASSRVFQVASNAVVELNHLNIQGGSALNNAPTVPGTGGGILVGAGGAALTLNHCTLAFNYALGNGGALALVANSAVTLNHCRIAHNTAEDGGGIYVSSGQVSINSCTFTGNTALSQGGAIYMSQSCTISNSSIHDNVALGFGGGIYAGTITAHNATIAHNVARTGGGLFAPSATLLTNCTVSGNSSWLDGGGIFNFSGASSAWVNSIVAGNTAPANPNFRLVAAFVSSSLTNGDPQLAALGDYGGPTPTMPPLAGSPAIDAGDDSVTNSLATDQRGFPRRAGAHVDIGAVESQVATNAPVLELTFTSSPDTDFTVLATTNLAAPASPWIILGPPVQNPPGQYQFTDLFAPDYPQRFYRVTSP